MQTLTVNLGHRAYPIYIGAGLLAETGDCLKRAGLRGKIAVVTNPIVAQLYLDTICNALSEAGFKVLPVLIPDGEEHKNLKTLASIYDRLIAERFERQSSILALGGGVIGDVSGFAAATYLRGVPYVQVPTTLLAQVDSSVGGKTAVNHQHGKNLIGAFYQPRLVVADIATLASLPEREFRAGLAEVIKYAAIMDAPMIEALERGLDAIMRHDPAALEEMVARSLHHKATIVASDAREGGLRKILNYGHTAGHALEASSGYGNFLHGEAVAIGMVAAGKLSQAFAGLSAAEAERMERLIARAGLPTAMPAGWRGEEFVRAMRLDKKRAGDGVEFVLLDRLGHALTRTLSFDEILTHLG
jgi:3-dehydroquinate synthase